MPEQEYEQFLVELKKALFVMPKNKPVSALFKKGKEELQPEYRFIGYDAGDKNLRGRTFGISLRGMGKGTITGEVKYFNANGEQVSFIQSQGMVGDGSMLGFDAFEKGMKGAFRRCAIRSVLQCGKNCI